MKLKLEKHEKDSFYNIIEVIVVVSFNNCITKNEWPKECYKNPNSIFYYFYLI